MEENSRLQSTQTSNTKRWPIFLLAIATLPRLVGALRDAGLGAGATLIVVRLMERLVTPVTAIALAAVVDALSTGGTVQSGAISAAVIPLIVLTLVMLSGHLGDATSEPLEYLVRSRIDGVHRDRVATMVRTPSDVGPVESPETQALIRLVRADPEHGVESTPGDGTTAALRVGAGLSGVAVTCTILASFAWWLVPIVVLPALVTAALRYRLAFAGAGAWETAIDGELHTNVWREANVSAAEGKDIRVFGLRDWMVGRMQRQLQKYNAPLWRHVEHRLRVEWIMFVLILVGLVPAYLLVTQGALSGEATLTTLTAVLAAGVTLFQLLGNGMDFYQIAGAGRVIRATDRLAVHLIDPPLGGRFKRNINGGTPGVRLESALVEGVTEKDMPNSIDEIRFEGVGFQYPGSERMILKNFDLEVRPGELLAVVGLNGAGKSTFIKLLCGLYKPTSGRITIDGLDLTTLDPGRWRSRLSVIFQDFDRYPLSVRENIVLGRCDSDFPDDTLLEDVARTVGLREVVTGLPSGWETPLSRERTGGIDLSGGQWQKVAMARALYGIRAGAEFLVADEPTAHLDVSTEFELFERLASQRDEAGIVLISHRLSTVRRADRIVLLDGGRITEEGTHRELIELQGMYAELFAIQAASFRRRGGCENQALADHTSIEEKWA